MIKLEQITLPDAPTIPIMAGGAVVLVALMVLASGFTLVPGCMDRQRALSQCKAMCVEILHEAKAEQSEDYGTYEASLENAHDPWENALFSKLTVAELSNSVTVTSSGPDGLHGTGDDISSGRTDVHIRKTFSKGIQSGAHSAGKGLTTGVIEGLGEASNAVVTKAKSGFKSTKSKLLSRFKKNKPPVTEGELNAQAKTVPIEAVPVSSTPNN